MPGSSEARAALHDTNVLMSTVCMTCISGFRNVGELVYAQSVEKFPTEIALVCVSQGYMLLLAACQYPAY